jgi:hypothetical protein
MAFVLLFGGAMGEYVFSGDPSVAHQHVSPPIGKSRHSSAAGCASHKSGTQFARGCLAAMQLSYKTLRILLIQFIQNMFTMAFNLYY